MAAKTAELTPMERWLSNHATPAQATMGMKQSVAINVASLLIGGSLWFLFNRRRTTKRPRLMSSSHAETLLPGNNGNGSDSYTITHTPSSRFGLDASLRNNSNALNYLTFLRIMMEMFITLTFVSAFVVIPFWGVQPLLLGLCNGQISLAQDLNASGLTLLCLLTVVFGVVTLVFVQRLQRNTRVRGAMLARERDSLERTVWLTHLPVCDNLTRMPFMLTDKDLLGVEYSLARALEDHLRKKFPGSLTGARLVERIHVPPVVNKWYDLDARCIAARERLENWQRDLEDTRERLLDTSSHRCALLSRWRCQFMVWRCERNAQKWRLKVEDLQWGIQKIEEGEKALSGSAFVTLKDQNLQKALLKEAPSCWMFGSYAYFNFGQPPFASVTLRCLRAPHPSDLLWENLHVRFIERTIRFWVGTILLLLFMVVLVTPVSVTTELNTLIPVLRRRSQYLGQWVSKILGITLPFSPSVWVWMSVQLPTIILLTINSVLLPLIIGWICVSTRSHTRSKIEVNQMNLNFVFLVLNQLLIPLLGLTGLPALVEFLAFGLAETTQGPSLLELLDGSIFSSPGVFSLRYILNCAFLTNTNSLLNLPQLGMRFLMKTKEPWTFAWGYWYASTLSILTTGVGLGILVPSILPCGAIFFGLKYHIDRYNLANRVYLCGPESQGCFIARVVHTLRMIVAGWWFIIGTSVSLSSRHIFADTWDAPVPIRAVEAIAALLVFFSIVIWITASWKKVSSLHQEKFSFPKFSSKESLPVLSHLDTFMDYIFGPLSDTSYLGGGTPSFKTFLRRQDSEDEDMEGDEDEGEDLIWDARCMLQTWDGELTDRKSVV